MPAVAQVPATCPDEPVAYGGTDEVVDELRALRVDVRDACLAQADRLDSIKTRADALEAEAQAELRHDELVTAVEANAPVDGSPAVVEAIDAAQLEVDAALWFIAGLLCSITAGVLFAREVLGD